MDRNIDQCTHEIRNVGGVGVVVCESCREVEWWGEQRPLDAAEGMARVFGEFDLVATVPGLRAPSRRVLVYRPPNRRARSRLAAFPPNIWLAAHPGLWLNHDGDHLLLAPTDPVLADNMTSA